MHSRGSKLTSVGVFVYLFVSQFSLVLRVMKLHLKIWLHVFSEHITKASLPDIG